MRLPISKYAKISFNYTWLFKELRSKALQLGRILQRCLWSKLIVANNLGLMQLVRKACCLRNSRNTLILVKNIISVILRGFKYITLRNFRRGWQIKNYFISVKSIKLYLFDGKHIFKNYEKTYLWMNKHLWYWIMILFFNYFHLDTLINIY